LIVPSIIILDKKLRYELMDRPKTAKTDHQDSLDPGGQDSRSPAGTSMMGKIVSEADDL